MSVSHKLLVAVASKPSELNMLHVQQCIYEPYYNQENPPAVAFASHDILFTSALIHIYSDALSASVITTALN